MSNTKAAALKRGLGTGTPQFGLVCAMPSFHTIEAIAGSGYSFFLIDAEHQPTDPGIVHTQLMALQASPTAAIIKLPAVEPVAIRQYLDLGADGLMATNVETQEDAERLVHLSRYPPRGVRGIAGVVRATSFSRNKAYPATAEEHFCLIALIESAKGVANIESIAQVDGVDVVFIGPGDLAADMGHLGNPWHPDMLVVLEDAVRRIRASGKVAGLLAPEAEIDRFLKLGATMFIVGAEMQLLVNSADQLAARLNTKYPGRP